MRRIALIVLALLSASCETWTEPEDVSCPPDGTTVSYENFARGFFLARCNECHAANVDDRKGAPQAYVFDTYDQVIALKKRVFIRSAGDNVTMPPGPDDPSQEERDMLAEWIACGAPETLPPREGL